MENKNYTVEWYRYFFAFFICALHFLSVMLGNSYLSRFLNQFKINGAYAYAIYCNHWIVNYFIHDFFPGYPFYPMLAVYFGFSVVVSVITTKGMQIVFAKLRLGGEDRG